MEILHLNPYLALFISIVIGVGGQISLKTGAIQTNGSQVLFLQPFVLIGLASYFVAALFYIISLQKLPVSIAYPTVSISYVAVSLLAHLLWGEPFGLKQIVSLSFICMGIFILSRP